MNESVIRNFIKSKFANKSILILGMGREGQSTYKFLKKHLPEQRIDLADEKPSDKLYPEFQRIIKDFSKLKNFDFVFISPGIPKSKYSDILNSDTQASSNTQLFFELVKELKSRSRIKSGMTVIGVTGTKGKSTTTALIHHVLKQNGLTSYLAGNIGIPALDIIPELASDSEKNKFAVLELSSHQLANLNTSPSIAVIQTIKEEHLDHFETISNYLKAKASICKYQDEDDLVIYFSGNKNTQEIANKSKAKKIAFRENNFIKLEGTKLRGKHNLVNMMPSIIIAQNLGISDEKIRQALASFKGLPHRLEFVASINRVDYYNDSLGTNPHATIAAIDAFPNRNIILIAGGYNRGLDYSKLAQKISKSRIKKLILFPKTGKIIAKNLDKIDSANASSMSGAVEAAAQAAESGDVVLLSPASASFGLFKDYADRGDQFKEEVKKLQ